MADTEQPIRADAASSDTLSLLPFYVLWASLTTLPPPTSIVALSSSMAAGARAFLVRRAESSREIRSGHLHLI